MATSNQFPGLAANIFNNPEFSDFEVHVEDRVFRVNKMILKLHSSVFRTCLQHDSVENQTNMLKIEDASAEMVELMVRFMYSENIQEEVDRNPFELFKVADRYNVEELKNLCIQSMSENLESSNICALLELAYQRNAVALKEHCICFVAANCKQIIERPEWLELTKNEPQIYRDFCHHLLHVTGKLTQIDGPASWKQDVFVEKAENACIQMEKLTNQFDVVGPELQVGSVERERATMEFRKVKQEFKGNMQKIHQRVSKIHECMQRVNAANQHFRRQILNGQLKNEEDRRQVNVQLKRNGEAMTNVMFYSVVLLNHITDALEGQEKKESGDARLERYRQMTHLERVETREHLCQALEQLNGIDELDNMLADDYYFLEENNALEY